MSEAARRARQTTVRACMDLLPIEPLLLDQEVDPLRAARLAAAQPQTRLIGVIDGSGILVGVVPMFRLAETVVARVSPETLLAGAADMTEAARFGTEVGARRLADVMLPPAVVGPDQTVDEGFRVMHERRMSGLYVVDADGRPIGYLDLLEVTIRYLEALEPGPDADD